MSATLPGAFVDELAELLDCGLLLPGDAALDSYQRATFATVDSVLGVARPRTVEQVAAVARLCQAHSVPFHALSSGKNWGYGSASPTRPGLCIDLRLMNRIRRYDERLGCVRIEPGVTLEQLYAFLQQRGGRFWIDAAGSSPACSVVGNTLERGFGHTPYADHAAQACALEVVLPGGEVVETGFGAFGEVKARDVYRPGLGPSVDGLFYQSNFGIVTAMTVWLMPAPEQFCAWFVALKRAPDYPRLVDALRALRLSGQLRSAIHLGNAYRVLPSFTRFPFDLVAGGGPLHGAALAELQQRFGVQAWHGSGALYGPPGEVRAGRRALRRALRGLDAKLMFIDDGRLALLRRLQPLLARLGAGVLARQIDLLAPAYGLLKGVPTDRFLPTVYWRKRQAAPPNPDPDRDRCGLIWCAVLSELSGEQADRVREIATDRLLGAGFEPAITATFLSERCLEHIVSVSYDRDVDGEDDRARIAFDALLDALLAEGYYPYRLPTFAQAAVMARASAGYRSLLAGLRSSLDPQQLFADGRYTADNGEVPQTRR
jgi:4-cresol dehydrogenase (hydroxylating)